MGRLQLLIVFGALLALTCGTEKVDPQNNSSPPSSTTQASTTASLPPFTFGPPTTNPTAPPTTTSTTPPTTKPTTPPTTKPTTPSTTTSAPTPKPEPPKPPKPIEPPTGDWRVNYTTPQSGSCIFAKMAIQIEMPFLTNSNKIWHAYVDIPENATASGNCDDTTESLVLMWANNSVTFNFEKKPKQTWYTVDKMDVMIYKDASNFPDMKNDNSSLIAHLVYDKDLFNTTTKMSYKCAKLQTFNLTMEQSNATVAYLHISHLHLQAFSEKDAAGFADAVDCEPAGTPDIVPIAAGCALAALIVIVLAAYLIGRKRSQARGYLSM